MLKQDGLKQDGLKKNMLKQDGLKQDRLQQVEQKDRLINAIWTKTRRVKARQT